MTHVVPPQVSSGSLLRADVCVRTRPRVSVLRIHEMLGLTRIQTYHSPIDIDGEWWATMRRLIESRVEYTYTRAGDPVCTHID